MSELHMSLSVISGCFNASQTWCESGWLFNLIKYRKLWQEKDMKVKSQVDLETGV